ncbi:hypothetical protein CkaCkLH20_00512 [Colletotrichum karsti]|uniref:Celp0028 effector like protein n=1 Tax=Colletotrichum karsti TaxID=1095194 RepID=A0A9P6IHK9_9PEZI|nr:uncharacterized protein CkaCkLH20_00512 [Colletotrichum karsti]KAF9882476.1 hypothetical protein CkaCkLH20_00512 [Colletotrichum karsti]
MISHSLVALLGLASAVSAMPPRPRTLAADDVILLNNDGSSQIMKAAAYDALEAAAIAARAPSSSSSSHNLTSTPGVVRRGCAQSTEVQVTSDESFLNWDVAISPVVSGQGNSQATAGVSSGYEIANTLEVGSEITFGSDEIIGLSLGMNLDMTWSSSQESSLEFQVPDGKFGVIVSQPWVRRVQGNVFSGCTDSPAVSPFTADAYESQSYGSMNWVKGVIRLCSSDTYPIPFCNGNGQHS